MQALDEEAPYTTPPTGGAATLTDAHVVYTDDPVDLEIIQVT